MSKNKKRTVGVFSLVALAVIAWYGESKFFAKQGNSTADMVVGGKKFRAEVVTTERGRRLGLGGRTHLCVGCAMLFVFPISGDHAFWMKDMQFPLDLLWLSQGSVVHVERNIMPQDQRSFRSPVAADKVLEINGGLCDKYGIREGDGFLLE